MLVPPKKGEDDVHAAENQILEMFDYEYTEEQLTEYRMYNLYQSGNLGPNYLSFST